MVWCSCGGLFDSHSTGLSYLFSSVGMPIMCLGFILMRFLGTISKRDALRSLGVEPIPEGGSLTHKLPCGDH